MVKKSKLPKYASNIIKKDKYRVFYKDNQGRTKKDNISNIAMSNIIGYYDAPDRNTLDTVVDKRTKKLVHLKCVELLHLLKKRFQNGIMFYHT